LYALVSPRDVAKLYVLTSSFFFAIRLSARNTRRFSGMLDTHNPKKGATGVAAIIEGKNYELICRNESGHRCGDGLHRFDSGRHGPGLAKAETQGSGSIRS